MNYTRRSFLKLAPGLASLPFLAGRTFAATGPASQPSGISLGHSLYGMQSLPLKEAVAQCASIGFRNVEVVLDPGFHCAPAQFSKEARLDFRRQLTDAGLNVSAMMQNLRLIGGLSPTENAAAIKDAAALAHDISTVSLPPLETTLGGKPEEWEALRHQMVDRLGEWATTAQSAGVNLVVKAHMNNAVDTPEKLVWLLDQVSNPAVAATYDYSHYEAHGLSLDATWATLASHTKFVHVKDTRNEGGKFVFVLPGEGRVDYPHLFRLLHDSGYQGPVVAEVSSMVFRQPGYDPVAAARKCYDTLSRALTQAGLKHA